MERHKVQRGLTSYLRLTPLYLVQFIWLWSRRMSWLCFLPFKSQRFNQISVNFFKIPVNKLVKKKTKNVWLLSPIVALLQINNFKASNGKNELLSGCSKQGSWFDPIVSWLWISRQNLIEPSRFIMLHTDRHEQSSIESVNWLPWISDGENLSSAQAFRKCGLCSYLLDIIGVINNNKQQTLT